MYEFSFDFANAENPKCIISDRFGSVVATATLVDDMRKLNYNLAANVRNESATFVREEISLAAKTTTEI